MKKVQIVLCLLIWVVSSCRLTSKQEGQVSADHAELSEKLETYFQALVDQKKFNGVVLVQRQGQQVHLGAYNMDDRSGNSLYVHEQSQFDIHSISKLMAKAAVLDLENQNLLSRADHVSKYITDFPHGDQITLQHLMDNQSGLPREFSNDIRNRIDKNPEEVIGWAKNEELLFDPGAETMYSNVGYELLYYIISQVSQKPFVQYLDEAYFRPLMMEHTGAHFHLQNGNLKKWVKNHEEKDGEIVVVPNIQQGELNQARIYSTVGDLLRFIDHIKAEAYLNRIKNDDARIGWSGGGDGILSHVEYCITGDYELAFFSNYDEIPFGNIIQTVEKIMTRQPFELPRDIQRKAIEIDSEVLRRYEGKYRVREFNNHVFEYRVENGQLVFYQNGTRGGGLNAETDSTFFDAPDDEDYFEFRKDRDGNYTLIFHYKSIEIKGEKEEK